jgi:hypothetical protein
MIKIILVGKLLQKLLIRNLMLEKLRRNAVRDILVI